MIGATVTFDLREVDRFLTDLQRKRLPRAAAGALNSVAFAYRRGLIDEMKTKFDRPTPYALSGFIVDKAGSASAPAGPGVGDAGFGQATAAFRSTGSDYLARVYLNPEVNKQSLSRLDTIGHQFTGGDPKFTGFERAMNRIGVLPRGWHIVPAKPTPLNRYGNVSPGLIVQMISYFQAFSEQGFRANATDRSRARRAKKSRSESGYLKINGVEYFISRGPGEVTGRGTWKSGRYQHLPAGIWSRRGTHGVDIAPVFYFTPNPPAPRKRIDIEAVARRMDLGSMISREFARRIGAAR